MENLGIDLGASKSRVCVLDETGEVLIEREIGTRRLASFLAARPASRVLMETCAESSRVAEQAKAAGHEVVVVPGKLLRQLGIGDRGIKTDIRDARTLAVASRRLPELRGIHLRSASARELGRVCDARDHLIGTRTRTVNAVRGYMRGRLLGLRTRFSVKFCDAVRQVLTSEPEGMPLDIALMLETIEYVSAQLERLTTELEKTVDSSTVCKLLMTMPGVGPITAARFVAAVDTPDRFESGAKLASYLALVPGEATTGGKIKRTALIRAGSKRLRATFVQAAWSMQRVKAADPLVTWTKSVAERRGKKIATVALARKMTTVLLAMWRSGMNYDPTRARPTPPAA